MTLSNDLLAELVSGVEPANDFLGDKGLMKALKVGLMGRLLSAELSEHLGYESKIPRLRLNKVTGAMARRARRGRMTTVQCPLMSGTAASHPS